MIEEYKLPQVYLHAFTDGRDVDPQSGKGFVQQIENKLKEKTAVFASLIGRYYAMDRDQRWERVKLAYDLLVHGKGSPSSDFEKSLQDSYEEGITDEFIKPLIKENTSAQIEKGDVVLFFNFRTDRGRELTQALSQQAFPEFEMQPLELYYLTLTNYDESFKGVKLSLIRTIFKILWVKYFQRLARRRSVLQRLKNTHMSPSFLMEEEKFLLKERNEFCVLLPRWLPMI